MPSPTRVVVVTGGSRGIGLATARRLAGRRTHLFLAARDPVALRAAAEACRRRGALVDTVTADLSDPAQVTALVRTVIARAGRLDVWVAAASVFAYGTVEQTPAAVYDRVIATNLVGTIHGVREALPHLRASGRGTVVVVGSLFSRVAAPYVSAYTASKFGVLGFAASLRQELLGDRRVRIKVVLPATIDTRIYQRAANYTGRDVHPVPPVVAPGRVARAVVRAARGRGRDVVTVGRMQRAAAVVARIAPATYDRLIRVAMDLFALRGRRNVDATDGAVFAPESGRADESGGWR
jgi:short-subunit dehydrogenase